MPKHKSLDVEDPELGAEEDNADPTKKMVKKMAGMSAADKELIQLEKLVSYFLECWYNTLNPHPAILYYLTRSEALTGFILYHKDKHKYRKWRDGHAREGEYQGTKWGHIYLIEQAIKIPSTVQVPNQNTISIRKRGEDRYSTFK